jgi:hypothetical protein
MLVGIILDVGVRSTVYMGKYLSDMFPIQNGLIQGNALSTLPFNFALKCAIRKV